MSDSYRRYAGYDRPSELTGVDIILSSDLATSGSGDFTTLTGADLITQALLRRLQTPSNGYRRLVRSTNGLQVLDEEYGNKVYDYLATPSTLSKLAEIEQALKECAAADTRIEVLEVKVQHEGFSNVIAEIRYRILSESELRVLQVRV